jgi:hypothetical protein
MHGNKHVPADLTMASDGWSNSRKSERPAMWRKQAIQGKQGKEAKEAKEAKKALQPSTVSKPLRSLATATTSLQTPLQTNATHDDMAIDGGATELFDCDSLEGIAASCWRCGCVLWAAF